MIVEQLPVLICRFLPDGTLTFVNQAYCRCFGKKRSQLEGSNFLSLIPSDEHERVRRHFSGLTPLRPAVTYEHKVIGRNGSIVWQRWTDQALFEKSAVVEYLSIGEDISAAKEAENKLRLYLDAIEASQDMIAIVDTAGKYLLVNEAFCNAQQLDRSQIIGKSAADILGADVFESLVKPRLNACLAGSPVNFEMERIYPKTGKRTVNVLYYPHRDATGSIAGIITSIRDVTEVRRFEEELQKKNIALGEVIAQIEAEKIRQKEHIVANIQQTVLPIINRLNAYGQASQYALLLRRSIDEIASSFGMSIGSREYRLTPHEIDICTMIRNGLSGKEIAKLLGTSPLTVEKQRKIIRKKLGLTHPSQNLAAFLLFRSNSTFPTAPKSPA